MTTTKSAKITLSLNKRVDDLIQRCQAWNVGAYKTANDQLYDLLADTYEFFLHIVTGDSDVRKRFNNLLKARNVNFQDNTPIPTRVVRLVFAIDRKRAHTYSNVLRVARVLNKKPAEIADWIRDSGGVQEISSRSSGGQTSTAKAKTDAEFASDAFAKSAAIAGLGKLPTALKPTDTSHPTYSIALIRSDDGTTGEIVWGTGNGSLLTRALAVAAKELRKTKAAEATSTKTRNDSAVASAAVKDLVAKVNGTASVNAHGKQRGARASVTRTKIAA